MGYAGRERRKHNRKKKPFIVMFQIREHNNEEEKNNWNMAAVLDFGVGGVLFYYNKKVAKNSLLDIRINFSEKTRPICCVSKVIRVDQLGQNNMFLVAVAITNISEEDKEILTHVSQ